MTASFATVSTASSATDDTSAVVALPPGTAENDLLVAAVNTGSGSSGFEAPAGWTAIVDEWTDNNDSAGITWQKIAGASEPASYTFRWTTGSMWLASIMRFPGADTSAPVRAGARVDHATGLAAAFTSTALSGVQADDLTVAIAQMGDDFGTTGFTITMPAAPWATAFSNTGNEPKYQGASYAAGPQPGVKFKSSSTHAWWNITTFAIVSAPSGVTVQAAAALSAAPALAADAVRGDTGSADLTAAASLTADAINQGPAPAASLSASGVLTGAARDTTAGAVALAASPALAVAARILVPAAADLAAAPVMSAGPLALDLAAALTAVPVLQAGPRVTVLPAAALTASAVLFMVTPPEAQHFSAWRPKLPAALVRAAPRWRFHAQALDGTWLHRDLPVTGGSLTWGLNGGNACALEISPAGRELYDNAGNLILPAWGCYLYAEEEDQIIWGGILDDPEYARPKLTLNGVGFADYANGFVYNGAPYVRANVDPLQVFRDLWDYIQTRGTSDPSLPGAVTSNLGLVVDPATSTARIGNVKDSSGQVLDVPQLSTTPGVGLEQFPANNGDNQLWKISAPDGQGYVTIQNKNSGLLVGVAFQSTAAGARVIQFTADGNDSQKWLIVNNGTFVTIQNKHSGLVMNVQGAAQQERAPIIQWPSVGADNEHWFIGTPDDSGYVTITSVATGKVAPYELDWWNAADLGQELTSLAQQTPFDFGESHTWTDSAKTAVAHRLAVGWPRLGRRQDMLRFAEGENISAVFTVTNRGTDYANEIIALGAGDGSSMLRSVVARSDGRLLRRKAWTDQSVTTSEALTAAARKNLTASQGLDEVTSLSVTSHPHAPLGSFAPGDDIPLTLWTPGGMRVIEHRITSYTTDLTGTQVTLTTARSDSFTYMPPTGSGPNTGGG